MKGKAGWHGESRRHSLARKGIRTAKPSMRSMGKPLGKYEIAEKYLPPLEDFEIVTDIGSDGEYVYYIRTPHDSSVGIFGVDISPTFDNMQDLKIWWHINGEKANDIWFNSKLEGQAFWDELKESLSGVQAVEHWKELADVHKHGEQYANTGDPRVFRKDSRLEVLKSSGEMQFQTPINNYAFERELRQAFNDVGSDGDYAYPNEFYTVILRIPDSKYAKLRKKAIAIAKKHGVELKFEETKGMETYHQTKRQKESEELEKRVRKEFPPKELK